MRRVLTTAILSLSLSTPAVALAQTKEDLARADALFNAARALLEAKQYPDACAKFAESKRIAPGLGVTLYLADCYEHIGRTASAWTEFRAAEGLARARNDARAEVARDRAQGLESKLDRLTVTVAPTVPRAGLHVLLDGAPVPPEEWGLAMAVDPGDHAFVVSSPDHPNRTFTTRVGPDAPSATVRVDSLEEPATPPPAASPSPSPAATAAPMTAAASPSPPPEPAAPSAPWSTQRWIGVGVGGAGVVGIAIGSIFGLTAKSKLDQSNSGSSPPCDATNHCNGDGLSLRQSSSDAATVSTIGFIAGGVALAGGVVLFLTAPRGASATAGTAWTLTPTPLAGGGGALVGTTF
jgi:hypothetical protein